MSEGNRSESKFAILVIWESGNHRFVHEADGTPAAFEYKEAAKMYCQMLNTTFSPLDRVVATKVVPYPEAGK